MANSADSKPKPRPERLIPVRKLYIAGCRRHPVDLSQEAWDEFNKTGGKLSLIDGRLYRREVLPDEQ